MENTTSPQARCKRLDLLRNRAIAGEPAAVPVRGEPEVTE
jgi:hypothetical protein